MAYNNPYYDSYFTNPYDNRFANPYMQNQYARPYQQQPQPQQQQPYSGFQWVRGEAAAKAFRAEPGQTVLLMDSDEPVLYVNSTDVNGKPAPMITYDLIERTQAQTAQQPVQNLSEYAKKSDIQEEYVKKSEIEDIIRGYVVKAVNDKMNGMRFTASATPSKDAVEL